MFNLCVRDRGYTSIIITLYGLRIDLESINIFLPEFLYDHAIGYFRNYRLVRNRFFTLYIFNSIEYLSINSGQLCYKKFTYSLLNK